MKPHQSLSVTIRLLAIALVAAFVVVDCGQDDVTAPESARFDIFEDPLDGVMNSTDGSTPHGIGDRIDRLASALTGQRVSRILELAWRIKESREKRVSTSEVNRFIERIVAHYPSPFYGGGTGKIYYATQVDVGPPVFKLFVNKRAYFSRSYIRYLNNQIRGTYGYEGTLIRLKLVEKDRKDDAR